MMKGIFTSLLFSLVSVVLHASTITLRITGDNPSAPALYLPDGEKEPAIRQHEDHWIIEIDHDRPLYAQLSYKRVNRLLWLTPGADMQIDFNSATFSQEIEISGDNREINLYLNRNTFAATQINDTRMDESAFIAKTDSMMQHNLQRLEASGLPREFREKESLRLMCHTYQTLPIYRTFHIRIAEDSTYRPSDAYWEKLKAVSVFDRNCLESDTYRSFIASAAGVLARHEFPEEQGILQLTAFIDRYVSDPQVAEYLVYKALFNQIRKNGTAGITSYPEMRDKYIKSEKWLTKINILCKQMESIAPGSPSPDFNCTDLTGKRVSLADLKGKYVYIDIWATWCGPCQREIPHMARLEEKYHGKEIHFVSISCDTNRKAWEKRVSSGKMKGIQLIFDPKDSFMDQYMITGIPYFILLDKEGKILSAKMTRPSNPETQSQLDKLLE